MTFKTFEDRRCPSLRQYRRKKPNPEDETVMRKIVLVALAIGLGAATAAWAGQGCTTRCNNSGTCNTYCDDDRPNGGTQ
jgi:hypothetical protein